MSGIYIIVNRINGKRYIGLSGDMKRRFVEHRSRTKGNCPSLYAAFAKYGVSNFDFLILEPCVTSLLLEREAFWIATLKPEYNRSPGGVGNAAPRSDKTKAILRECGKRQWARKTADEKAAFKLTNLRGPAIGHAVSSDTRNKLRTANEKPVVQIVNGLESWIYASGKAAEHDLGIRQGAISAVLTNREKSAGECQWKYFLPQHAKPPTTPTL